MGKKIIYLLLILPLFFSCEDKNQLYSEVNIGKEYIANINILKNGISITEEQEGGASISSGDVIAIQIKDEDNTVVAGGLFNASQISTLGLQVTLRHGINYTIESTLVKDANNKLAATPPNYLDPFNSTIITTADKWTSNPTSFTNLSTPAAKLTLYGLSVADRWYYKRTFTGNAKATNPQVNIDLRRVSFAIKYIASGLASGYKVEVCNGFIGSSSSRAWKQLSSSGDIGYETPYTMPDIENSYELVRTGMVAQCTSNFEFLYRIKDASNNVVKTSPKYSIGNCKAGHRYSITLECATEKDFNFSIYLQGANW